LPDEPDLLLINRYGDLFEEITPDSLVTIDHEGQLARGAQAALNTAGIVIHTAIHKARPDAACVIHTHTDAGVAVSSLAEGLMPLNQTALWFYNQLAYHDYEGIAFEWSEQERLVQDLGQARAMILRNHGLMTIGRSVGEAFSLMYQLEKACRIQLACWRAALQSPCRTRRLEPRPPLSTMRIPTTRRISNGGRCCALPSASTQIARPEMGRAICLHDRCGR
jgi:ribulose-5-phosphate 4-epimerase/fuculose-1-phosphate aldolase